MRWMWLIAIAGGCARKGAPDASEVADSDRDDPVVEVPDPIEAAEEASRADEPPYSSALADSTSAIGHFHLARQASTFRAGPLTDTAMVQVMNFEETMGDAIGASPWHVVSPALSDDEPIRIWGATLTHAYKVKVENGDFSWVDGWRINAVASSIPWNIAMLADGTFLVPDQNGYRESEDAERCATTDPTFLRIRDDGDVDSPLHCEAAFAPTAEAIREACGVEFGIYSRLTSGLSMLATFTGELGTLVNFDWDGVRSTYLLLMDGSASEIRACGYVDDSAPTNEIAVEPEGPTVSALYVPTGDAIVKLAYDAQTNNIERRWERKVPVRGRTGTTPTLVDTPDGERFVVTIDARCATVSVTNGLIACADEEPSRLVAVRRSDDVPPAEQVVTVDLPEWLDTVENSPASRRGWVVVANSTGYLANGLLVPAGGAVPEGSAADWLVSPDAVADHATGIIALRWDSEAASFVVAWEVQDRQVSSVPTISGGANLVYGTGSEEDSGKVYLYGFVLEADERGPGGHEALRVELGKAPFRTPTTDASGNVIFPRADYTYDPDELFDGGNSILVNRDRSLLLSMGSAIVRVADR